MRYIKWINVSFRIVLNELPRVLRECREMIVDQEDATLQQIIKRLVLIPEKERASSILDLTEQNEPLTIVFENFRAENMNFVQSLDPQVGKY